MKKMFTLFVTLSIFCTLYAQTPSFESTFYEYELLEWADKAVIADLNGDELPDFIVSWETQRKLYIGLNNGLSKPDFTLIDDSNDLRGLSVVDIDQDGDLDFVGAAPFENASFWWENDGTATFTKNTLSIEDYNGIHFADLNGDSQLEAIVSIDDGLYIYKNEAGNLTRQVTLFEDFFGDASPAIETFDNNGDGILDIVATFNRNGIFVYQQTGDLSFETIEVTGDVFNQTSIFPSDINQDGAIDFVAHSSFSAKSSLLINNNDGTYTLTELPKEVGRNEFTTVGDIDQDGDDDILYYEEASASLTLLSVLINNGGAFTKQALSEEYSRIGTGGIVDLDKDGDNDLFIFSNDFFTKGLVVFDNNTSTVSTATFKAELLDLNIFPTFINSSLQIETNESADYTYLILDAFGKEITSGEGRQNTSLNCSSWANGAYFIFIKNEEGMQRKKLIKVK